jgi:hypothetical protein
MARPSKVRWPTSHARMSRNARRQGLKSCDHLLMIAE